MVEQRPPVLDPVASIVQKLAVLLAAGVTPASSWLYLAEQSTGSVTKMLALVGKRARAGEPVSDSIMEGLSTIAAADAPAWRGLAAAWRIATEAGAPLSSTLREFAASLRSLAQLERDLEVALAGSVSTARLVMVLPVLGVLLGLALGFDTIGTLFATGPGLLCLLLGLALMATARLWSRGLVARARPKTLTPGLTLDLMAIALSGGASIPRAVAAVDEAKASCALGGDTDDTALAEVLELSQRAGVPAAALLRSEADEQRRVARSDGDRRAAILAVTLMLPLGVCVLPAFMLLGVAPLLISVISSTVDTF
ncbi:MAG: hypothetical protein JWL94_2051 [Microbacteriaceae bacterium]|jgi:tight adherence protein B|nr:hypothetical protein [Microbacteriaceae bacterium]HEV7956956.1 type II secretion system F family protein [Marisediminicola sp.]